MNRITIITKIILIHETFLSQPIFKLINTPVRVRAALSKVDQLLPSRLCPLSEVLGDQDTGL